MIGYLILLFTILPALELIVLIEIGGRIGSLNTIMVIILTGVLGASLARMQGFLVLRNIQNEMNRGIMPSAQMVDGLLILVGGIVLLTPGFITDAFGILLLIPWTRTALRKWLSRKFEDMIARGQVVTFTPFRRDHDGYDDIDIG